ncbi:MAG: hydroxyacylglutathione hydrolase [Mariprofundaceae bacterium]
MWTQRHRGFRVHLLPALKDNYIHLIEPDNAPGLIAVDPAEADPVASACNRLGKRLSHLLITHHHWDHTGANEALKAEFSCTVHGNANDASRIPALDHAIQPESTVEIGGLVWKMLDVPGHTMGHVAWLCEDALFCGDTLFSAGCGRLFEGTPATMWHSLSKLARLPAQTRVYCAHEYTLANLRFAAHLCAEPPAAGKEPAVTRRFKTVRALREGDAPSIPSDIREERLSNPFLWPGEADFCHAYANHHHLADAEPATIFAHLRARKDTFAG